MACRSTRRREGVCAEITESATAEGVVILTGVMRRTIGDDGGEKFGFG